MKRQGKPRESITLSKRDYENLQQRLVATQNLTLILLEKENEITKLNYKLKSLEQNLFETHKRLGQMTLEKGSPLNAGADYGVETSQVPEKGSEKSVLLPSHLSSVVADGDLSIIQQQEGIQHKGHFSGKFQSDMCPESEVQYTTLWQLSKEPPINYITQDKTPKKEVSEAISLLPTSSRRLQSLSDIWSLNSTVSKQNFHSAIRELKKTKTSLRDALSKSDSKIMEVMKTTNYIERIKSQEDQTAAFKDQVERLMEERDLLQKQIEGFQHFKRSLREETEGVSVPPPAISPNEPRIQEETSRSNSAGISGCSVIRTPRSPLCKSPCSGDNEISSETRLKEKKLQDDLNLLTADYSCMKKERDDLKANYETLLRSMQDFERRINDSVLIKEKQELLEENIEMRRELKDLQEENTSLLKSIETVSNDLSMEGEKSGRLRAELQNEKQSHNYTVYKQHERFLYFTQKLDNLTRENKQLRKQLESQYSAATSSSSHALLCSPNEYGRKFGNIKVFTCDHCLMEFYDEKEHIEHFQKCAP